MLWIFDTDGGIGKTWFSGYLWTEHKAFVVRGGKYADIALAYQREPLVVFDLPREMEERVPYALIEQFKDGRVWSGKYQSKSKVTMGAKVMVLANFSPDLSKMSDDRWQLYGWNKEQCWMELLHGAECVASDAETDASDYSDMEQ